jgi:hypothetical protein
MTRARLDAEELDLIEHAMIEFGRFQIDEAQRKNITKALQKLDLIRKCSKVDGIDISPAHGG